MKKCHFQVMPVASSTFFVTCFMFHLEGANFFPILSFKFDPSMGDCSADCKFAPNRFLC